MSEANESTALVNTDDAKKEYHTLGNDETYAIDVFRTKPPPVPFYRTAIKSTLVLACSPLIVFGGTLYYLCMSLGPLSLQHWLLSQTIPRIMRKQAERFGPERDTLLANVGGKVLDVGCGGGAYLKHYRKANQIIALEPVTDMHAEIRRVAKEVGIPDDKLTILPWTIEKYVKMQADTSTKQYFDWIILGNILCEVHDPLSTLQSVNCLTRRGGHVYFSEHEGCFPGTWKRRIQNVLNPWWKVVRGGCNCNRDTLENVHLLMNPPEWELAVWQYPHYTVCMGPSFLGLARKSK